MLNCHPRGEENYQERAVMTQVNSLQAPFHIPGNFINLEYVHEAREKAEDGRSQKRVF